MKRWIVLGILVALALGWYFWPGRGSEKHEVSTGPLNVSIMVPGKVEAVSQEIRLSFDMPGIIEKIHVKEGDEVEAGAVIAELRHEDLKAKMEIAKWELQESMARRDRIVKGPRAEEIEEAEALVRQYESEQAYQKTKLGRKEKLNTAVSQEEVALAKLQFEQASEKLAAEQPVPVANLADTGNLQIRAEVDETHVQKVRSGQKAWVSAEAFSGEKFPAKVARVLDVMGRRKTDVDDPKAKVDTRVLEVLLDVPKSDALKLGLRVDVQIQVGDQQDALLIPRAFVTYAEGSPSVFRRADGKLVLTPIVLGVEQGPDVEVRSGLAKGDIIVRRAG